MDQQAPKAGDVPPAPAVPGGAPAQPAAPGGKAGDIPK